MAANLIIIISVVILPFLTYYVTSSLFFRRINSKAIGKKPPTIPYFVPGLFNAVGFAQLGARKHFAELIKDYGAFAPFRVRAGPHSYVVLRDPTHVGRVLDAPEHLTAAAVEAEMFDKLFGSPKAILHVHQSNASTHEKTVAATHGPAPPHLTDTALAAISDTYVSILSANMHNKMFQFDTWTQIEDLWSFLQQVLIRCTLETLFGSALFRQYPRLVRDYLLFDAATEGFVYGMPRIMISAATKPRDRLHQGMETWLKLNRNSSEDLDLAGDDSVWDEKKGLRFIRERDISFAKVEGIDINARAAEMLSTIHTSSSELVSSTFWMTVETLRKSHLTRNMIANIGQHSSPGTKNYDIRGLAQTPLVQSIRTEVRRLRTATCVLRTNKTDGFPLDKHWSLPKGATVAMFSHDISLNADIWTKLQPRAVGRPLEEFWAERFMGPEHKAKGTSLKPKKDIATGPNGSGKENLEELVTNLTTCVRYPGSRFISALQTATLAVLFAEFEVQLCDSELVDAVLPPLRELAYGTVKPLDKIAVRIRQRKV